MARRDLGTVRSRNLNIYCWPLLGRETQVHRLNSSLLSLRTVPACGPSLRFGQGQIPARAKNQILSWRIQGESARLSLVDEGRKRVLLIAASILAARKLAQYGSEAQVPATICAIADAVRWAERIMQEIDRRWPAPRKAA
jgi:hypothetical protein